MQKLGRNDLCWCKSGKKYKSCHWETDEKLRRLEEQGHMVPHRSIIKNRQQIEGIRKSGLINIAILDYVADRIEIGMTTEEIDRMVAEKTKELGGIPAPLGFEGFPKSVCTSIGPQVCHGIPSRQVVLKEGDILNVDVSTIYNGYYSDSSRMFCLGQVSQQDRRLVDTVKACVELGLQAVRPWGFLGDMSHAINQHAKQAGYQVVEDIGGHGVGLDFHEEPWVSYVAPAGTEMVLVPGMVFTIEPMINMGSKEVYIDESDGWTVYTQDGKPSAQWEITVLVTEDGHQVLAY